MIRPVNFVNLAWVAHYFWAGNFVDYIPWTVSTQLRILQSMNSRFEMLCKSLGENVRAHRKNSGISQEEFAFQAELDRTYISQIERGIGNPSLLVLFKIATVLDLRVIDLFEEAPAARQSRDKATSFL